MKVIKLKNEEPLPINFTGIVEGESGTKVWYKNGNLHREDGPACEYTNGSKYWWVEGKRHRIDGPAIECGIDGTKEWLIEDTLYFLNKLEFFINKCLYLGTEKGKYDLCWLKFLTENQGVKEFPIIPGFLDHVLSTNPTLHEKIKGLIDDKKT